jgi:hypothetical protein
MIEDPTIHTLSWGGADAVQHGLLASPDLLRAPFEGPRSSLSDAAAPGRARLVAPMGI